jgi:hypothetical protein
MGWPVSAFHSRTVSSSLPLASRWPSGLNATLRTELVCPVSGAPIGWPVSASHSRTVWSAPELASLCPSGLTATLSTLAPVSMILTVLVRTSSACSSVASSGSAASVRAAST